MNLIATPAVMSKSPPPITPASSASTQTASAAHGSADLNFPAPSELLTRVGQLIERSASPRQLFLAVPHLLRESMHGWLAVVALPERSGWMMIDAAEDAEKIDSELLRLQMLRSPGGAVTIRLADGQTARSLHATVGEGSSALGVGLVYLSAKAPEPFVQVTHLQELQSVATTLAQSLCEWLHDSAVPCEDSASSTMTHDRPRFLEFHRSLDPLVVAKAIAAEGPWLVGCDRVSVLLYSDTSFRLSGVSGVAVIDRRSQVSVAMERLCRAAMAIRQPLSYANHSELPPQIDQRLQSYLDASCVQSGHLLPVFAPIPAQQADAQQGSTPTQKRKLLGAIAFENFAGQPLETRTHRMQQVCDEAAIALNNAMTHRGIFLLPVWRSLGSLISPLNRYRTILAVGAFLLLLLTLCFVQTDYKVVAVGVIEPASVQDIFAPADGQITRLYVQDGDMVKQGDLLVEVQNADLEQKSEEITGEIFTTRQKLDAIDSLLTSDSRKSGVAERSAHELTIERKQLQAELSSLEAQREVIDAERQRQRIVSPIDGQVIGWRLSQRLNQRPVSRGHRLFSIMNSRGDYQLHLQVTDRDSSDLLTVANASHEPLAIDFVLATEPDHTHSAKLTEIANSLRVTADGHNVLDVLGMVQDDKPISANIGAEVTASIHCGRRSLLSTWFGDVYKFYHHYVRFYFS